jgi:hypothetical protein
MNLDGHRNRTARQGVSLWQAALLLALCVLAAGGCNTVQETANLPMNAVTAVVPGMGGGKQIDPGVLQAEVLRYADAFTSQSAAAMDDYAERVHTPEVQTQTLEWKLFLGNSVLQIATGQNPTANLLDLVSLATLTRSSLELQASNAVPPGAFDSWLDKSRALETNAWRLAAGVLTTAQTAQLRDAIEQWRMQNPADSALFYSRPLVLSSLIRQTKQKSDQTGGIFNLGNLDPLGGLDPAVREITRGRLLAERIMFAVQRMPFLMRWQVQLLSDQLLNQSQVTNTVQSVDRISRAADSMSQSVALLPDQITAERKAIMAELQSQEGQLRGLSQQVGQTLNDGQKMSDSLNKTLITFTALMKQFGVGEPSTNAPDTNSPPFNILDYAHTADQITAASAQLDVLVKDLGSTLDSPALDKRIADLNVLAEKTQDSAKAMLNHAFLLAAGLVLLTFVCALVYRRIGRGPPKS